jgi:hypothetical protein
MAHLREFWPKIKITGNLTSGASVVALIFLLFLIGGGMKYWRTYQQVLAENNFNQGGIGEVLSEDDDLTLIVSEGERSYQYIKVAWETRMDPEKFWQTLVREGADPAGMKGVSDLGNYHFYDQGLELWENWGVVRFDQASQKWIRER